MRINPTFGDQSMAKLKSHYTSGERDQAKAFLEANGAVQTDIGSEFYSRWLTLDGNVWVEYDDPPFYILFLELPKDARDT
jgi:hypothetical protein